MEGLRIGRYVLGPDIASGGMASVHLGRMLGPGGFGKTVAMKRLHAQYARDPEFVKMFHDEARVTSGLTHPNIVMTLDVLEDEDSLYLVMEYVHGASLTQIHRRTGDQSPVPQRIIVGIIAGMLDGLNAAHEARDEKGDLLNVVHRDVSPQNVLVSFQGVAKIADFGIAKAAGRSHSTGDGSAKGKISYMAPEQVLATPITAKTDIYAAGIVLWESLTGKRLIDFNSTAENVRAVLQIQIEPPSKLASGVSPELDKVVLRAVERSPAKRFATAKDMATALRKATDCAHPAEIGDWLKAERPNLLAQRDKSVADLQRVISKVGATLGSTPNIGVNPSSDPLLAASLASLGATPAGEAVRGSSSDLISDHGTGSGGSGAGRDASGSSGTGSGITPDGQLLTPAGVPTRRPRWMVAAILAVGVMGIVGAALVLMSMGNKNTNNTTNTAGGGGSTSLSNGSSDVPKKEPALAISIAAPPSAVIDLDDPGAPSASGSAKIVRPINTGTGTATAVIPTGPRPRKCRIVTTTDGEGHTKFTEVCQ